MQLVWRPYELAGGDADDGRARAAHAAPVLTRPVFVLCAALVAGCAASPGPSGEAQPSATPARETPLARPSPEAAASAPVPTITPAPAAGVASAPAVRIVPGRIEMSAPPALEARVGPPGGAEDATWWAKSYLEVLERASGASADQSPLALLGPWVRAPYADILARSLYGGPRSYELVDVTRERAYWKPWGSFAFSEVTLRYRERHAGLVDDRTVRLRVVSGGQAMMIVVDAFDAPSGTWLSGDRPQYSGLLLEAEVATALSWHLHGETYAAGAGTKGWTPADPTPYERWRAAFIATLDARYASGAFSARRLEDVSARILRFEPASFLGDGVVTVRFEARVVTTSPAGEASARVAQTIRFFRSALGGWSAIDEQLAGGTWASGGDLALAQVDRFKG